MWQSNAGNAPRRAGSRVQIGRAGCCFVRDRGSMQLPMWDRVPRDLHDYAAQRYNYVSRMRAMRRGGGAPWCRLEGQVAALCETEAACSGPCGNMSVTARTIRTPNARNVAVECGQCAEAGGLTGADWKGRLLLCARQREHAIAHVGPSTSRPARLRRATL